MANVGIEKLVGSDLVIRRKKKTRTKLIALPNSRVA